MQEQEMPEGAGAQGGAQMMDFWLYEKGIARMLIDRKLIKLDSNLIRLKYELK